MSDNGGPARVDTGSAHSARIYDYIIGGKDYFATDKEAGDAMVREWPALPVHGRSRLGVRAPTTPVSVRRTAVRRSKTRRIPGRGGTGSRRRRAAENTLALRGREQNRAGPPPRRRQICHRRHSVTVRLLKRITATRRGRGRPSRPRPAAPRTAVRPRVGRRTPGRLGRINAWIAASMYASRSTVKTHVACVQPKFPVRNRVGNRRPGLANRPRGHSPVGRVGPLA
ncbi:SAM-dependent methyltransferase [Streptomyces sp. NBC_00996]|uniref:SAM-dependent methyltransferase n=1 Tax=Streptomyces sp. NBC_00996 TaxID=2903710 RepID=UPI00386A141B|nr:SAM-dependent methyltransferase [Streptomyces sp. NBC_00996]